MPVKILKKDKYIKIGCSEYPETIIEFDLCKDDLHFISRTIANKYFSKK